MLEAAASSRALAGILGVGLGWLFVGRISYIIASVATIPLLARMLTPTEFGVMAAVTIVLSLVNTITESGFVSPIIQLQHLSTNSKSAAFFLAIVIGFVLAVAITLFSPLIEGFFSVPGLIYPLAATAIGLPIRSAAAVSKAIMVREHQYRKLTLVTNLSYFAGYALPAVVLAWFGYGVWALVIPTVAATVLEMIFILWLVGKPAGFSLRVDDAGMLYSGVANTCTHILNWGALSAPNIIVARMMGVDVLGLYSRASKLFSLADQVLVDSIRPVFLSGLSAVQFGGQGQTVFSRVFGILVPCYCALSALLIMHSEAIVRIMLGSQWLSIVPAVQVLFFAFAGRAGYKTAETFAMSKGQFKSAAVRQAIYLVLVIVGTLAGSGYGLLGVVCGFAGAIWAFYLVSVVWVTRLAGFRWTDVALIHCRALFIAFLAVLSDASAMTFLVHPNWLFVHIAGGTVGLSTIAALLYFAPSSFIGSDLAWARARVLLLLARQRKPGEFKVR